MDLKDAMTTLNFDKIVDFMIRIGVLIFLFFWCFEILRPFVLILIWAIVIAIAVFPIHTIFVKLFRGRRVLAVIVLTLLMLSLIIVPSVLVSFSLYEGVYHFKGLYESGEPLIPPPGASTKNWPVIMEPVLDLWRQASEHFRDTAVKYQSEVTTAGKWIFSAIGGIGKGIIMFNISIVVAGILLGYSNSSATVTKKIFYKLLGQKSEEFTSISVLTVRNVVKGVLGVAIIQSLMAGIGFYFADVPFAGLWTIACLIFAIIQVGVGPVVIPITIYMFSVTTNTTAIIFSIWMLITLLSDNVLKPILLGRNAPAPMLIIFIGSIGGFIQNGFIGLFLGAVILTLGYKLFIAWLNTEN